MECVYEKRKTILYYRYDFNASYAWNWHCCLLCCLSFGLLPQKMDYDWSSTNWCFMAYFLLYHFKKMPLWVRILRRCFVHLLCVLLGFSGYLLHKSHQTLNKVSVQL